MKKKIVLTENWKLTDLTEGAVYPVSGMPKQVHTILEEAGRISDRYIYGDTADCGFIPEHDWCYETVFSAEDTGKEVFLSIWGVDTAAEIYVNDILAGWHDDFYLPLRLEISGLIQEGENRLRLVFPSVRGILRERQKENPHPERIDDFRLLRKSFHDFTSYLGGKPQLIRVGLFADCILEVIDEAELTEADITYVLNDALTAADVEVCVGLRGDADVKLEIAAPDDTICYTDEMFCYISGQKFSFRLTELALWNPRGFGEQNRYTVRVTAAKDGRLLDVLEKKIGFRKVETTGNLDFVINHRPVRLYGGNVTPINGKTAVIDKKRLREIFRLAYDCNMNTLRIWGEGERLPEELYEEADRCGMLIWQEFFSGNAPYPNTQKFRRQIRQEAECLVRTLKHHPSILLWCGGNECYLNRDFGYPQEEYYGTEILEKEYREVCARLDPDRYYHVNSPFGGAYSNDPAKGDTHSYTNTWFVPGGDYPNFVSENLRVSLPAARSMKRYLQVEEAPEANSFQRKPGDFPWPQEWNRLTSADSYYKIPEVEQFYDADNFEALIYRFGAAAGAYLRNTVERYRRGKPVHAAWEERRCKGHLVWKLNTTRPHIYSSILDYYLEPYIPYYALKRAYEPVLVSFEIGDRIYAWIVNDSAQPVTGNLQIRLFDTEENRTEQEFCVPVRVLPGESTLICNLDEFGQFLRRKLIVGTLTGKDGTVLTQVSCFADIERHLRFPDAALTLVKSGEELLVTTDRYAHCVELSGSAEGDEFGFYFSDNYFSLLPGTVKHIRLRTEHTHGQIRAKEHYSAKETKINF